MCNFEIEKPVTVKIDKNGVLKLPKSILKELNLKGNETTFNLLVTNDNLLLQKKFCVFCENNIYKDLKPYKEKMVCKDCLNDKKLSNSL